MAGFGDLSFVWSGYSAALISCALQTTYLLLVERTGTEKGGSCSKSFKRDIYMVQILAVVLANRI